MIKEVISGTPVKLSIEFKKGKYKDKCAVGFDCGVHNGDIFCVLNVVESKGPMIGHPVDKIRIMTYEYHQKHKMEKTIFESGKYDVLIVRLCSVKTNMYYVVFASELEQVKNELPSHKINETKPKELDDKKVQSDKEDVVFPEVSANDSTESGDPIEELNRQIDSFAASGEETIGVEGKVSPDEKNKKEVVAVDSDENKDKSVTDASSVSETTKNMEDKSPKQKKKNKKNKE